MAILDVPRGTCFEKNWNRHNLRGFLLQYKSKTLSPAGVGLSYKFWFESLELTLQ